jgi:hypothetical protein
MHRQPRSGAFDRACGFAIRRDRLPTRLVFDQ